jgi:hypothetical protein
MDDLEIIKALEEIKKELNISNDDVKKLLELGKIMFCNANEDKGESDVKD